MGCGPLKGTSASSFRDNYELGEKVGAGAMAQVRTCRRRNTGETRVVKIIRKPYSREDFELEVKLLEAVGHGGCPNIVTFHEHYEDEQFFYSVMELCSGGELFDVVAEREEVSEWTVAKYTMQILTAVEHVHSLGIVHRDLKPQNLLFENATSDTLKLIDFGLSFPVPERQLLHEPCGTPELVAPEMVLGQYGRKIDIWSVGVLVYMLLFGDLPFEAPTEKALFRRVVQSRALFKVREPYSGNWTPSAAAIDFVKSLLRKDLKKRPTAQQALAHVWLQQVAEEEAEDAPRIPLEIRERARTAMLNVVSKEPVLPQPEEDAMDSELRKLKEKPTPPPIMRGITQRLKGTQRGHRKRAGSTDISQIGSSKLGASPASPVRVAYDEDNLKKVEEESVGYVRGRSRRPTRTRVTKYESRYASLSKYQASRSEAPLKRGEGSESEDPRSSVKSSSQRSNPVSSLSASSPSSSSQC